MRPNKGFSLIELMIVVGIIGILSLLAFPIFKEYRNRAIVAEGLVLSSTLKSDFFEFLATNGLDALTAYGSGDNEYTRKFYQTFFDEVYDPDMPSLPMLKLKYPISSDYVKEIEPFLTYTNGGLISSFNMRIKFKESVFDDAGTLWEPRHVWIRFLVRGSYYDKDGNVVSVDAGAGQSPKILCGQGTFGQQMTDPSSQVMNVPRSWLPLGCRDFIKSVTVYEDGALDYSL